MVYHGQPYHGWKMASAQLKCQVKGQLKISCQRFASSSKHVEEGLFVSGDDVAVKTKRSPFVHIKIAGIYGCSLPTHIDKFIGR